MKIKIIKKDLLCNENTLRNKGKRCEIESPLKKSRTRQNNKTIRKMILNQSGHMETHFYHENSKKYWDPMESSSVQTNLSKSAYSSNAFDVTKCEQ